MIMKKHILLGLTFFSIQAVQPEDQTVLSLVQNFEKKRVHVPQNAYDRFDYTINQPIALMGEHLLFAPLNHPNTIGVLKKYLYVDRSKKPYILEFTQIVYEFKYDHTDKKWLMIPFIIQQNWYSIEFEKPVPYEGQIHFRDEIIPVQTTFLAVEPNHFSESTIKKISALLKDSENILDTVDLFKQEYLTLQPLTDIAVAA